MQISLTSLGALAGLGFDEIIDVRSPAEYAEDHLPGAINLPVLSDEERARVGTIYKQVSPFTARKTGAALVARNAAFHLENALADRGGGWRPLVYCWRGGQRSGGFATILSQIGWRVGRIEGGYKSWRGLVVTALAQMVLPERLVVLDGNTGSAKTELLALLAERGHQVIDLEGLAHHRGSLFGGMGPQPSQKAFEGRLAYALAALDPHRPVVIEAESAKIGERSLPGRLWQAICSAPRIVLEIPRPERAAYLTRAYADLTADPADLLQIVEQLRPYHPAERIAAWIAMAVARDFTALADGLMEFHYDPRYARHRARGRHVTTGLAVASLAPAALPRVADALAARLDDMTREPVSPAVHAVAPAIPKTGDGR